MANSRPWRPKLALPNNVPGWPAVPKIEGKREETVPVGVGEEIGDG